MRAYRGLLAAFGASTSLIAAAAFALLAVSAVVAFQGWPLPRTPQPALETSALIAAHDPGTRRAGRADGAPLALPGTGTGTPSHAASRRRATGTRRGVPRPPRPPRPAERVAASPGVPAANGSPVTATQGPSDPPVPRPDTDPPPRPGDPVREAGDGLGKTTEKVTGTVGKIVEPVSPEAGKGVEQVGGGLGQTLTEGGETVGGVVDGLLGGGE